MAVKFWVVACLAMLLIAFSKAGFGGGPGVLSAPMMTTVCKSTTAIAIMLPVMIFCDIWCVWLYWKGCVWQKVFNLLSGFVIGVAIATYFLAETAGQEVWLKRTIGLLALLFGLSYYLLFRNKSVEKYVPQASWFGVLMGIFAGISSTLAHAAGPPIAMYLLSQGQKKEAFMGTIVVYSFIGNLIKVPSYIISRAMTIETIHLTLPLVAITPLGLWFGWWLNKKMPEAKFESAINALLIIIGLYLLVL